MTELVLQTIANAKEHGLSPLQMAERVEELGFDENTARELVITVTMFDVLKERAAK